MVAYAWRHQWARIITLVALGALVSSCASFEGGPPRLYTVADETAIIRNQLAGFDLVEFSKLDEGTRRQQRNVWIGARMYAMDLNYTAYEANLTRERQGVGFGATAATLGLTTASTLATHISTKDTLTTLAGLVTGARAAYNDEVLIAHSMQWIQSQMRAQRARVGERILRGMKASTTDYPLAAALSDLEEYYRAGTFTGGIISTSETVAVDAKLSEQLKAERVELAFVATPAGGALRRCAALPSPPGQRTRKARLLDILPTPPGVNPEVFLIALQTGQSPRVAENVLATAHNQGICP
jgi:hypothetical protein